MAQSRSASGTKKNTSAKKSQKTDPPRGRFGRVSGPWPLYSDRLFRKGLLADRLAVPVCFFQGSSAGAFLSCRCVLPSGRRPILGFHRGRPEPGGLWRFPSSRALGAAVHLLVCKTNYGFDWLSIRSLYYGGINLENGGVVSGLLSIFLERAVSVYGAPPVFIIALFSVICVAGKVSLRESGGYEESPAREYEPMPEPVPEKPRAKKERGAPRERAQELPASEIFAVPEPANASAQPQEGSSGGIFPPPEESGDRHPHRGRTSARRTDPRICRRASSIRDSRIWRR